MQDNTTIEHVMQDCICKGKKCPKCQNVLCLGKYYIDKNNRVRAYCIACYHDIYINKNNTSKRNNNYKTKMLNYQIKHTVLTCKCEGRICCICKEALCVNNFNQKQSDRNLLSSTCKKCCKNYPSHHKELRNMNMKVYYRANDNIKIRNNNKHVLKKEIIGSFTVNQWEKLKHFYNYTCLCCSKKEPEIILTIDHIVPISKNGSNDISNIQPLCMFCNLSKGTKIIDYRNKVGN